MVAAAVGEDQVSVNSWLEACVRGYRLASPPATATFLPPTQKPADMNKNTRFISKKTHTGLCTYFLHEGAYQHNKLVPKRFNCKVA